MHQGAVCNGRDELRSPSGKSQSYLKSPWEDILLNSEHLPIGTTKSVFTLIEALLSSSAKRISFFSCKWACIRKTVLFKHHRYWNSRITLRASRCLHKGRQSARTGDRRLAEGQWVTPSLNPPPPPQHALSRTARVSVLIIYIVVTLLSLRKWKYEWFRRFSKSTNSWHLLSNQSTLHMLMH